MVLPLTVVNLTFQKYLINQTITDLCEVRLASHFKMDSTIELIIYASCIFIHMDSLCVLHCQSWKGPSAKHKNNLSKLKIASWSESMLIQFFSYCKCLLRLKYLTLLVKYLKHIIEHIPTITRHPSFNNQPRNR